MSSAERPTIVVVVQTQGRQPLRIVLADRLELGRECDGLLVADPRVSRHHVELTIDGESVIVRDLGSANGTWVDGGRLDGRRVIDVSDVLHIGSTTVRFERVAPP